jgi:hypothetical protein
MNIVKDETPNPPSSNDRYLLPKGHPSVEKYKALFQGFEETEIPGLKLHLNPYSVKNMNHDLAMELIAGAQHHPKALEKMLLKTDFSFLNDDNSPMPDAMINKWLNKAEFQEWSYNLFRKMPYIIFFLRDKILRFYAMVGVFSANDHTNKKFTEESILGIKLLPAKAEEVNMDLSNAGYLFMDYCMVAGIDPKPYMEKVFDEFDLDFDYDILLKSYTEGIAAGQFVEYVFPKLKSEDEEPEEVESIRKITPEEASPFNFKRVDLFKKDRYLVAKGSHVIGELKQLFGSCDGKKPMGVRIGIPHEEIIKKNLGEMAKFWCVMQHYPKGLQSCMNNFDLFMQSAIKHDQYVIKTNEFIGNHDCREFLKSTSDNLRGFFFVYKNLEFRLYSIIGNLEEENQKAGITGDTEGILKHKFTAQQVEAMQKKARLGCKFFMEYCHTAGVNSQKYINEMIRDMNFDFTYKDVEEDYNAMVKAGYSIDTFTFTEQ